MKLKVITNKREYEDRHYAIPHPDPIEATKLKMAEKGIKIKTWWEN